MRGPLPARKLQKLAVPAHIGDPAPTLCVLVAERTLSHVGELDCALATGVHEPVAALGVKLGGGDDLRQLLHVGRLDVDNVEALILNVQVPEVDPQVIAGYERLPVRVDGYAVDMIGVCVRVCPPRHRSNNRVVMSESG